MTAVSRYLLAPTRTPREACHAVAAANPLARPRSCRLCLHEKLCKACELALRVQRQAELRAATAEAGFDGAVAVAEFDAP